MAREFKTNNIIRDDQRDARYCKIKVIIRKITELKEFLISFEISFDRKEFLILITWRQLMKFVF